MGSARMTIPMDIVDIEMLKKRAEEEGRTFSGYIQRIILRHMENNKEVPTTKAEVKKDTPKKTETKKTTVAPKRKKRVLKLKRRK